jgi:hypothetical protein
LETANSIANDLVDSLIANTVVRRTGILNFISLKGTDTAKTILKNMSWEDHL